LPSKGKSLVTLIAVALAVRIGLLFTQTPIFWPDSPAYFNWAWKLAVGSEFINHTVYRTPGFPYLLAFILKYSSDPGFVFLIVQYALGVAATGLVFLIFVRFSSTKIAFLSSLLFSLNPLQLYYESVVQTECLFTFLFICWLWAATRFLQTQQLASGVTLSAVTAALALTRPLGQLLILLPLFLALLCRNSLRSWMLTSVVVLLSYIVLVTPWILHNRQLYGHTGLSIDFGLNVYHRVIDKNLLPIPTDRQFKGIARTAIRERLRGESSYITVMHILHRTGNTWVDGDKKMLNFALNAISLAPFEYLSTIPKIFLQSLFFPDPSPAICQTPKGPALCNHAHQIRDRYSFPGTADHTVDALRGPVISIFRVLGAVYYYFVPIFVFGIVLRWRRLGTAAFLRTDGLLVLCILYFTLITAVFNSAEDRFRLPFEAILFFYLASITELFERGDKRHPAGSGIKNR
jgi:4-amino-4-deoxy-L-arabinose transferase-like glycosyltransferase